jgi:tetratricopeptide (TPR) repeat protein
MKFFVIKNSQGVSLVSKITGGCRRPKPLLVALLCLTMHSGMALCTPQQQAARIEGTVRDTQGKPVAGASLLLQDASQAISARTQTDANGAFVFLSVSAGAYAVKVEKSGFRDTVDDSIRLAGSETKHCEFVLRMLTEAAVSSAGTGSTPTGIELDDRPNFTVAGITDSTGSGGHGSETRMRTGEGLARETVNLESGKTSEGSAVAGSAGGVGPETRVSEEELLGAVRQSPRSFESNHVLGEFYLHSRRYRESIPPLAAAYQINPADRQNALDLALAYKAGGEFGPSREVASQMLVKDKNLSSQDEAKLRRMLGDLDEALGDPLGAVKEDERAASLDGSEENYFAWGAELLLHRAAVPASEVFSKGVRAHPHSARMLAGLGAALYTSGSADEAAQRLCEASDLEPSNPEPYLFLGKMQEATSTPLPCAEQKLARFFHEQPENAQANYYYALALWKRSRGSGDSDTLQRAEALLMKASALDPKLDMAYLQLGNLYFARGSFQESVDAYQKAIAANSADNEAHYRLGLAYKKIGDEAQSQREFDAYKQLDKSETAAVERQRRELRQFVFVLKDQPATAPLTPDQQLSK